MANIFFYYFITLQPFCFCFFFCATWLVCCLLFDFYLKQQPNQLTNKPNKHNYKFVYLKKIKFKAFLLQYFSIRSFKKIINHKTWREFGNGLLNDFKMFAEDFLLLSRSLLVIWRNYIMIWFLSGNLQELVNHTIVNGNNNGVVNCCNVAKLVFLISEIILHCRLIINIFNNIIWLLFVSNIFKKQLEMLKDINQLNWC